MACTKHGSQRETWVFRAAVSRFTWQEVRMPGGTRKLLEAKGCVVRSSARTESEGVLCHDL